ncbi:MAG: AraC family transcriptional regulator [Jejuia sp.]
MNELIQSIRLSLLHAGYDKLDNNWNYKNVISPFVRLFLITKGNAVLNFTNQTFNLSPGNLYLIPSYLYNSYRCDTYHEQYYVGFFEEIQLGTSIFNVKQFNCQVAASQNDYDLFKRLLEIHPNKKVTDSNPKTYINNRPFEFNIGEGLALNYDIETQGILSILLSRFLNNTNVINETNAFEGDLNKVLIYISKHLQEPLSIKFLAAYCNVSPDHFTRSFNSKFGITPNKYIQIKRIERAQVLLLTTKDSLEKIALDVGMPNMSYFSRKFKEMIGVGPGAFRKNQFKKRNI